jgi:hypothetical protein
MKQFFAVLFIFSALASAAQKNKGQNFHWVSGQSVIAVMGGQYQPNLDKLNDSIKAWGGKVDFYEGLRGYGITGSGPVVVSRGGQFDGSLGFSVIQKTKVSIGTNDSLTFQLSGWNLLTSIYGKDVIPGRTVALVLAPGVQWGSVKMIRSVNGNGGLYKNGYIAPMVRAELRFVFGFVALGARGCYRYDFTSENWNQKSGPDYAPPGIKSSGRTIEFFVGWGRARFE